MRAALAAAAVAVAVAVAGMNACDAGDGVGRATLPHAHPGTVASPVADRLPGALAAPRLPPDQEIALAGLADPGGSIGHVHGHGHGDAFGAVAERRLAAGDRARFDRQWAAAADAARRLATPEQAAAAGYVRSSASTPGVGVHWIDWMLVDRPFDPAMPSMLLFDQRPSRPARLMGFAYWVRSATRPAGFAGVNDRWHRHRGLCFTNGTLEREDVPDAAACPGYWLDGRDLWMLHAWVVPGSSNRWGRFAPTNPDLCPLPTTVPDVVSCQPDRGR